MTKTKEAKATGPVQIGIRVDAETAARVDALAAELSRPGMPATRADAVRVALMAGLEVLERKRPK